MNKRIFELALQAGFSSWVLNPSKETMSDTPELLDKFAELLVRECMTNLYIKGHDDAVIQLREEFGVELL